MIRKFRIQISDDADAFYDIFYFFLFFVAKLIKHFILSRSVFFFSFLGGIRAFFILTKFFSLVLGKIRDVSLPFIVDGSDHGLFGYLAVQNGMENINKCSFFR
jgi:hypothetical protein